MDCILTPSSVLWLPLLPPFHPSAPRMDGRGRERESEQPARWIDEQGAKEVQCIYLSIGWLEFLSLGPDLQDRELRLGALKQPPCVMVMTGLSLLTKAANQKSHGMFPSSSTVLIFSFLPIPRHLGPLGNVTSDIHSISS